MKFIALILSVIVLFLTTVPCCALEDDQAYHQEEKAHKCIDKDDDCCKDCSPFYVCGRCVGFTITSYSAITFGTYLRPVQHDSIYLPVELTQTTSFIWQPPKLS
ncbi:DUF6660 family protein [Pedobacter sp. ok626]|uniref:DUF6660 family protein n=1 Tax=Pedobacter sp. ok626 TaxID=1761882 RepID=UPI001050DB9B|nr:DUF6660 family protein [Pedobacter sp. ok626]